jgi:hypothetical protein
MRIAVPDDFELHPRQNSLGFFCGRFFLPKVTEEIK